jgi:rhodanese-related sulfurtransferase
MFANRSTC